jgi:hypothetical protein
MALESKPCSLWKEVAKVEICKIITRPSSDIQAYIVEDVDWISP